MPLWACVRRPRVGGSRCWTTSVSPARRAATVTIASRPPRSGAARKLMSCIFRCEQASGFSFGAQQVIDVLRGKATQKVLQFGHERLSTFGIGADLDANEWRSV